MTTNTKDSQAGTLKKLSPKEAERRIADGSIRLIDVREPDEFAAERLEGAENVPLSRFAAAELCACGDALLVYCRSGQRSSDAAHRLCEAGASDVLMLEGGLLAWKEKGLPTRRDTSRTTISIMRQVQITVGALNLIGFGLAWGVSPWFLGIPVFTSAGLLFAGVTGTCGMALMLGVMPWNRSSQSAARGSSQAGAAGSSCATGSCN